MIAKINGYPTEEELRNRIVRHLGWRGTDTVALLWRGYLASLLEWGLIEPHVYRNLHGLLPKEPLIYFSAPCVVPAKAGTQKAVGMAEDVLDSRLRGNDGVERSEGYAGFPKVGIKELDEIFANEPLSPEREAEIDKYLRINSHRS